MEEKEGTAEQAALEIWNEKFKEAQVVFLGGSIVRGEATDYSDLDLVIVFDHVERAWRESFLFKGWPVEVFAHDPATLNYFFQDVDAKSGCPSLPQMVMEAVTISGTSEASSFLKELAREVLRAGPKVLSQEELDQKRYAITDLMDDIRQPRSSAELMACGAKLFEQLADFYFRSNRLWSATGKTIFRRLQTESPQLAARFELAFVQLFSHGDQYPCLLLAEEILSPSGGALFDGYRQYAPSSWRL